MKRAITFYNEDMLFNDNISNDTYSDNYSNNYIDTVSDTGSDIDGIISCCCLGFDMISSIVSSICNISLEKSKTEELRKRHKAIQSACDSYYKELNKQAKYEFEEKTKRLYKETEHIIKEMKVQFKIDVLKADKQTKEFANKFENQQINDEIFKNFKENLEKQADYFKGFENYIKNTKDYILFCENMRMSINSIDKLLQQII